MEDLTQYYRNDFSERGEDGILEEIFRRIGINSGTFVEFGAADGIRASNTRSLLLKGWNGLYIESNSTDFKILENNCSDYSRTICINQRIETSGSNSLDNTISKNLSIKPNLISIDIDGFDFEIMKSMEQYLPDVILVECNPYRNPIDKKYHGPKINNLQESLYQFQKLGKRKGYRLVCYTQNAIFVKEKYRKLFDTTDNVYDLFKSGMKILIDHADPGIFSRMIYRIESGEYGKLESNWLKHMINELKNDKSF